MAKGKKFTAAEKHFFEKEIKYQKEIQQLKETIKEMKQKKNAELGRIHELEVENDTLKQHNERLLKYMDLNESDIKLACQKDKELASTLKMLNIFTGNMRAY